MGPGLGGGHGWNQGRYGLGLDQFIEANVVLGDGSLLTISEESEPDLFWALRGAGHNFGIVTSVRYKIYDVAEDNTWFVGKYAFTQEKLEAVFDVLNGFTDGGNQPIELRHWTNFFRNTSLDTQDVSASTLVKVLVLTYPRP
jgi:FAD/FMN-containing dehydrogenase